MMDKKDYAIIFTIMLAVVLVNLNFLHYPLAGDSVSYVDLANNLANRHEYTTNTREEQSIRMIMPLLPFVGAASIKLAHLFGYDNILVIMRLLNAAFNALTIFFVYLFSVKLGMKRIYSVFTALFLASNAFFINFMNTSFILTEPLAMLLLVMGYYYFFFGKRNRIIVSGILFSMSVFTRHVMLFFIAPVLLFEAVMIIKRKKIKESLVSVGVIVVPLMLWVVYFMVKGIRDSKGSRATALQLIKYVVVYDILAPGILLGIIGIGLIVAAFFEIKSIYKSIKNNKNKISKREIFFMFSFASIASFLVLFIVPLFFVKTVAIKFTTSYIFSRTRYVIVILPFSVMVVFSYLSKISHKIKKPAERALLYAIWAIIAANILFAAVVNSGYIQDKKTSPIRNTFVHRQYHRHMAIEWAEENAGGKINAVFSEPEGGMAGINIFKKHYFKKNYSDAGFDYLVVDENSVDSKIAKECVNGKSLNNLAVFSTSSPVSIVLKCVK